MISVIMGINCFDAYTSKAIDSILSQTFSELELIIIANGEFRDDVECNIIKLYPNESRLRIIKSQIGQLAHALNIGIDNASFDYIARMDSDDIAWPDRLEKQLAFLQNNNLDMVGCDLRLIDERDNTLGVKTYPKGSDIFKLLPFKNCFAHNTIIYTKSLVLKARGYNAGFNSEDYDLWFRLKRIGVRWENMDEILLDYRIHNAASQRRLLGYAESSGLSLREFILEKNFLNFIAVLYHIIKSFIRPKKSL